MNVNFEDHRDKTDEKVKSVFVDMMVSLSEGNLGAVAFITDVLDKAVKEHDEMAALALTRA